VCVYVYVCICVCVCSCVGNRVTACVYTYMCMCVCMFTFWESNRLHMCARMLIRCGLGICQDMNVCLCTYVRMHNPVGDIIFCMCL